MLEICREALCHANLHWRLNTEVTVLVQENGLISGVRYGDLLSGELMLLARLRRSGRRRYSAYDLCAFFARQPRASSRKTPTWLPSGLTLSICKS